MQVSIKQVSCHLPPSLEDISCKYLPIDLLRLPYKDNSKKKKVSV